MPVKDAIWTGSLWHSLVGDLPGGTPVLPPPNRPVGSGITRYEDTTGVNLSARVDSVGTSQQVSLDVGTFEFADFAQGGNNYGAMILQAAGLRGSGIGHTILRMTPNTSTRASAVPASNPPASNGQTNPLRLLRVGWENAMHPRRVGGFTLEATPQGHLHHGFIGYYLAAGSIVEDILVKGVPGDMSREPGETFAVETFRCPGTVSTPVTVRRVEVDGRNAAGTAVTASAFGTNFGEYIRYEDTYAHDLSQAHGYAMYETGNLSFLRARAQRTTLNGFNFENVSGTVTLNQCVTTENAGYHLGIFTNKGNAIYTITDPIFDGPKLRVRCTGYSGQARTQSLSDIHLIVNGVERPDLLAITTT